MADYAFFIMGVMLLLAILLSGGVVATVIFAAILAAKQKTRSIGICIFLVGGAGLCAAGIMVAMVRSAPWILALLRLVPFVGDMLSASLLWVSETQHTPLVYVASSYIGFAFAGGFAALVALGVLSRRRMEEEREQHSGRHWRTCGLNARSVGASVVQKKCADQLSVLPPAFPLLFLYVPVARLVVLSIVSLNLYGAYWIYKNWCYVKKRDNLNIEPFWRGVLGVFYCHSLLKRIHADPQARAVQVPVFSPSDLTMGGIILSIGAAVTGYAYGFTASLLLAFIPSFVSLVPVQNYINAVAQRQSLTQPYHCWSSGHNVCLVIGIVFWAQFLMSGRSHPGAESARPHSKLVVVDTNKPIQFCSRAIDPAWRHGKQSDGIEVWSNEREENCKVVARSSTGAIVRETDCYRSGKTYYEDLQQEDGPHVEKLFVRFLHSTGEIQVFYFGTDSNIDEIVDAAMSAGSDGVSARDPTNMLRVADAILSSWGQSRVGP